MTSRFGNLYFSIVNISIVCIDMNIHWKNLYSKQWNVHTIPYRFAEFVSADFARIHRLASPFRLCKIQNYGKSISTVLPINVHIVHCALLLDVTIFLANLNQDKVGAKYTNVCYGICLCLTNLFEILFSVFASATSSFGFFLADVSICRKVRCY